MVVSKYLHSCSYNDECVSIWHSVFGRPMLVSADFAKYLLNCRKKGRRISKKQLDEDTFDTLVESHILIESHEEENMAIEELFLKHNRPQENKVKHLSLIMCEECPFRCTYCIHFANSKHYYNPEKMMTESIAKESIDKYLASVVKNHRPYAYINFGGGEPLLNYSTIAKLLPYIDQYRKTIGIPIRITINTNLSLLTEGIAETLIKYGVEIATSLDGTKEGNDQVRLNKDLSGTYDQIIHGFDILKKLGRPIKSFAMTVTEKNFFDVDTKIIDWAASRNIEEVRIDIDVVGMVDIPVEDVVRKLTAVREYAKKLNILVDGFWSRSAENLGLIPEEEDIGFCGGERGNSACIAPSGQVFPCGYSNYQLGHYTELSTIHLNSEYQELLARRNLLKLETCKACPIFGFCRGGCLITKEANNSPEKNSYMCKLYIAMTEVIIRESVDD